MVEKIFDGNDIYAGIFEPETLSIDCFVVTFNALIDVGFKPSLNDCEWTGFRSGFGEKFLTSNNIKSAYVCNYTNHWWHTSEFKEVAKILSNNPSYKEAKTKILYGSSMGSYGALMLSRILNPDLIVCAGPRVLPDKPGVNNGYSNEVGVNDIDLLDEISESECDIKCFYDPLYKKDNKQFMELLSRREVDGIQIPFSDHMPLASLRETGFLKKIILGLFQGENVDRYVEEANISIAKLARTTYLLKKISKSLSEREEADIFRELALSFQHIRPDIARFFIETASELRPEGSYINKIKSNLSK